MSFSFVAGSILLGGIVLYLVFLALGFLLKDNNIKSQGIDSK